MELLLVVVVVVVVVVMVGENKRWRVARCCSHI